MAITLSANDIAISKETSDLSKDLWEETKKVSALSTDPKAFSLLLFRRLWNHYKGFTLLWDGNQGTEAAIILRSGLETSICLAANFKLGERFVDLAKDDLIETLKRQIKMWRSDDAIDMVRLLEAHLRELQGRRSSPSNPKAFDFGELAKECDLLFLYNAYRELSGGSAHVTGLSILRGVVGENMEGKSEQDDLHVSSMAYHFMLMTCAVLYGCKYHAYMIGADSLAAEAYKLLSRLDDSSKALHDHEQNAG